MGSLLERSLQESCQETSYRGDLVQRSCQDTSFEDLVQRSCQDTSFGDLVQRRCADLVQSLLSILPKELTFLEGLHERFHTEILHRYLLGSCQEAPYTDLAKKALIELSEGDLAHDVLQRSSQRELAELTWYLFFSLLGSLLSC